MPPCIPLINTLRQNLLKDQSISLGDHFVDSDNLFSFSVYEYSEDKIDAGLSCDVYVNSWWKRAHFQFIVTENSLPTWWTSPQSKISLIFKTLIHGPSNIFNLPQCSSAHISRVYGRLYVTGIVYTYFKICDLLQNWIPWIFKSFL